MHSNLKLLVLLLTTLVSTIACKTTLDYEKEKDSFNERKVVKNITEEEQIKLTYQFKKSLSYNELKELSQNIKLSMNTGNLSPQFKNTLENSVDASIDLLEYSELWEKAFQGNSSVGTTAAIGVIALALGDPSANKIPLNSSNYYVPSRLTIGMTNNEVTMMSRQKTLDLIKEFFTKLNYDVICELGCIDLYTAVDTNEFKLWLGIKNNTKIVEFNLPIALEVNLNLTPLVNANDSNIFFQKNNLAI
jgi:hypothetical protein